MMAADSAKLASVFQDANKSYAQDYPATMGMNMAGLLLSVNVGHVESGCITTTCVGIRSMDDDTRGAYLKRKPASPAGAPSPT